MILQGMGIGSFILAGFGIIEELIEELIIGINRGLAFLAGYVDTSMKAKSTKTNPPPSFEGRFMPSGGNNPPQPRPTGYIMGGR